MNNKERAKYYADWDIPPCFWLNEAEEELDDFYKFVPDDEDVQGWEQWEKEEKELLKKAPLFFTKVNIFGLCERMKIEKDNMQYEPDTKGMAPIKL